MLDFFRNVWSKTSGKVTLVVVAVVFLAAAVGTIYGIAARPGDLGFMTRDGVELRWDNLDLPVQCFYVETVPESYEVAWTNARRTIREAVGVELLGPCVPWRLDPVPKTAPDGVVLLRLRGGSEVLGASTEHRYDKTTGRILSVDVSFDAALPPENLDQIALHEAGHVLGLDHDREESSSMYPAAAGRSKTLSTRDVALLKTYLK